jgi:hypothetical protein
MVGLWFLVPPIGVRIPVAEPIKYFPLGIFFNKKTVFNKVNTVKVCSKASNHLIQKFKLLFWMR